MLITCKTPLRISFFGGGTDYPEYISQNRGAVVGMAINKYIYISMLQLNDFLEYKYRISYSKHERVNSISDIEHPVVRAILHEYGIEVPLDISVLSDLPARSGLGSSSSFTVGFLHLVSRLNKHNFTKYDLAEKAIFVERELLNENVGLQDQFHAAFGGINKFEFYSNRTRISPVRISGESLNSLTESLCLVFTGIVRSASDTLDEQIDKTKKGLINRSLEHLLTLTDQAIDLLESNSSDKMLADLGGMLDESWQTKRNLSNRVSNQFIDDLYTTARYNGALGGKLCGAGGGGFFLLVIPKHVQNKVADALAPMKLVPVGIDTNGSSIIFG